MDSEEDASGSEAESELHSGSGSDSGGVAGLAFASKSATSSFFINNESEDEAPAYCFMAKGSKVSTKKHAYDTSDSSSYECNTKVSYNKLAKIASI